MGGAYRNSRSLFRTVPSPIPYGLPFPKIGVRTVAPHPKLQSLLSQERVKLRTSNLARTKAHEKFWRKGRVGLSRDCPNFLGTPYYLRNGKSYRFQTGQYILRVHPNKSPLKFLEKRERGRIQGMPNFSGTPYYLWNGKSYGFQIWPIHSEGPSEQKPMGVSRDCLIFFVYPLLSQERLKLRNSNFARTFVGSIGTKAH